MASSRSIVGSNVPGDVDGLDTAVLEEAFEAIDEVEDLLAGVAERAPADLVEPRQSLPQCILRQPLQVDVEGRVDVHGAR